MVNRRLRYLWAYTASDDESNQRNLRNIESWRRLGYDVEPFLLSPKWFMRNWRTFQQIDVMYRNRDPVLMRLYEMLGSAIDLCDVFIHANGANVHPQFLEQFPNTFKCMTCSDDPESSPILSQPIAAHYDLCFVANAAEVETYHSWGAKAVFWAQGSQVLRSDIDLTEDEILERRMIPIVFFGGLGGAGDLRRDRMLALSAEFPEALCAGSGWDSGWIPTDSMHSYYKIAGVGWNVHNSTGPINFRLYDLSAFGVMQICDCKSHLGMVYEIGKEVEGLDTIEEAIDLTRYYVAHVGQQREMALAAHRRWKREYHPDAVWQNMVKTIEAVR